ncbi:type III secretion system export apparatus subunit SctR [Trinickia dinghuensis]|uniref:EscR/YscR/HrcR family type III secretion system export apparatus protein n=1 Tax=Trinickia dinghuensis TaxID=2291023 RepID=A0A3D8JVR9_9BURK|nr:type III secretion system export apparatus subunit SctR [Trinickia dinghuensis]RDU96950.1 EscR/YscR/HrcR family type III secretion system export apparatus protein [Trinickia dinghuensis]
MAASARAVLDVMILDQNPLALLALLALLSLLPLIAIATTSYLKLSVVLVLVRNALGVQQAPTTLALNAIALVGTLFVMAPTLSACMAQAREATLPQASSGTSQIDAALKVVEPLRQFVLRNGRADERERFLEMARKTWPETTHNAASPDDWSIAVPAFVVSELQSAFEIGLLLFVPFVAVDLLVSNVLLAMGMQMVPPSIVALPIKLLLFVLADGWGKLLHALVLSYHG